MRPRSWILPCTLFLAACQARQTPVAPVSETPSPFTIANLPTSTLFDFGWDDLTLFRDGLIKEEQESLLDLPGASLYHIELEIADDLLSVNGREEVLYTNREAISLSEVGFRLFPNLADGSIAVLNPAVNGRAVEPSFELQNSAMGLPLDPPLEPGVSAVLQMDFSVEVPSDGGGNYGTFAFVDDVLALANFYPMIAVYDDEGWNLEIAPEIGDVVYADASFYLVRVTAPAELTLVTSGVEIDHQEAGGKQTVTFTAGPGRDFYLAASGDYARLSQSVGDTVVNHYAPAAFEGVSREALDHAVEALRIFNQRFGPYPYTELDLVMTGTSALGVEYPGITAITVNLYDPNRDVIPASNRGAFLEATVAHEVAHQWFYNLVGNDQVDEPWIDEALAQYATLLYFGDRYGPSGASGFRRSLDGRWQRVDRAEIPIGLPVASYTPQEYGAIVYGRGPLFFEALAETMGVERFDAFLQDYTRTLKWGIATTESLKNLAEARCECDLGALFRKWVYEG